MTRSPKVYIAASFKHVHAVRLMGRELRALGYTVLDWTEMATPPPGLTPTQRRAWMDTDREGGQVFAFCKEACLSADIVVYFGESGQDAGVEVGIACGAGVPVLGIRGPLEAPGLMLHGAVTVWTAHIEDALDLLRLTAAHMQDTNPTHAGDARVQALLNKRSHSRHHGLDKGQSASYTTLFADT